MSKKHLFLHIGTEKTGTTSIQSTLHLNQAKLREKNILFPSVPLLGANHSGFVYSFLDLETMLARLKMVGAGEYVGIFKSNPHYILDMLSKQIEDSGCHTVIISSELLHSVISTKEEIKKIKEWAKKEFDEITVVCYLRRQVDLAVSAFSTRLKEGGEVSAMIPELFANFIDHMMSKNEVTDYVNYRKMLDQWSHYFPNIICREFSKETLSDGDVVKDFLSLVSSDLQYDYFEIPKEQNQSLDGKVLELLSMINQYIPKFVNNTLNLKYMSLIHFFEQIPVETKMLPSLEMATMFQNFFIEDNQYISEKYFNNKAIFKSPMKFSDAYASGLSPDEIVVIFVKLWTEVRVHLLKIKAKNKFLHAEIALSKKDYKTALKLINQSMEEGIRLPEALSKRNEIFELQKHETEHSNESHLST